MADFHVLDTDDRESIRVVFHYAVPNTANSASLSYRTALIRSDRVAKDSLGVPSTVLPTGDGSGGTILADELASLQAGAIAEQVAHVKYKPDASPAALRAHIRAIYQARKSEWLRAAQAQLRWFGYTDTVA